MASRAGCTQQQRSTIQHKAETPEISLILPVFCVNQEKETQGPKKEEKDFGVDAFFVCHHVCVSCIPLYVALFNCFEIQDYFIISFSP